MKSVNLIPALRRDAKRRRAHVAVAAAACGAYAAVLACGLGAAHLVWAADRGAAEGVARRLDTTHDDIRRLTGRAAELRAELTRARATLEANRTIAEQPDWSVLMALLAGTTGDDVVLRSVSVAPPPATSNTATPAGKESDEVVLELAGVGQTQLAVSRHVLRLEQTGLFAKVTLLETGREAFLNAPAIGFRLRCSFGDAGTPPHALSSADAGGTSR